MIRRNREIDWTFGGLWPYEPHWFESADGRMHYVDVGPRDGRPVVMVHGNPTWAFLFRNFIGPLADAGYRAIVPDLLGFGRSDKPDRAELYTIDKHVERFDALLESLDLHEAVVVPQDWGGPIGLAWATAHPERIAGLFILNTYAHRPPANAELPLTLKILRGRGSGDVLVKGLGLFHRVFLFRVGMVNRKRLTRDLKRAYLAPHPTWASRTAVLEFPRSFPSDGTGPVADLGGRLEEGLRTNLGDRPIEIVWPMHDPGFPPEILDETWMRTFPDAKAIKLEESGHYIQEDAHELVVPELLRFLDALEHPVSR